MLNPGDLFVYLENPASHPRMKVGELRYVRCGLLEQDPNEDLGAEPSPRSSDVNWMAKATLDAAVLKLEYK
jgi:hypothetical protein